MVSVFQTTSFPAIKTSRWPGVSWHSAFFFLALPRVASAVFSRTALTLKRFHCFRGIRDCQFRPGPPNPCYRLPVGLWRSGYFLPMPLVQATGNILEPLGAI